MGLDQTEEVGKMVCLLVEDCKMGLDLTGER